MLCPGKMVNPHVVRHLCIAAAGQLRVNKGGLEHPILGGGIGVDHLGELASSSCPDLNAAGFARGGVRLRVIGVGKQVAHRGRPDVGGLSEAPVGRAPPPTSDVG